MIYGYFGISPFSFRSANCVQMSLHAYFIYIYRVDVCRRENKTTAEKFTHTRTHTVSLVFRSSHSKFTFNWCCCGGQAGWEFYVKMCIIFVSLSKLNDCKENEQKLNKRKRDRVREKFPTVMYVFIKCSGMTISAWPIFVQSMANNSCATGANRHSFFYNCFSSIFFWLVIANNQFSFALWFHSIVVLRNF